MRRERRIRVVVFTRSDPCAAIDVPNPPLGTKLVAIGSLEVTVSIKPNQKEKEILKLKCFTNYRVNGNTVSEEEFYKILEGLWSIVDDNCELVKEWSQSFSPCPSLSERQYLCPKTVVKKIMDLGVVASG